MHVLWTIPYTCGTAELQGADPAYTTFELCRVCLSGLLLLVNIRNAASRLAAYCSILYVAAAATTGSPAVSR
jgi:hypothetical protein